MTGVEEKEKVGWQKWLGCGGGRGAAHFDVTV